MQRRDGIQQAREGGGFKTMPSTRETTLGSVVIVNNGHIHCTIFIESHPKPAAGRRHEDAEKKNRSQPPAYNLGRARCASPNLVHQLGNPSPDRAHRPKIRQPHGHHRPGHQQRRRAVHVARAQGWPPGRSTRGSRNLGRPSPAQIEPPSSGSGSYMAEP